MINDTKHQEAVKAVLARHASRVTCRPLTRRSNGALSDYILPPSPPSAAAHCCVAKFIDLWHHILGQPALA